MLPMKILISESEIQDRVRQLGSEISQDYNARMPTLVCVLKGSIIFFADVVRAITLDVTCEFVQISSYDDKSVSSGEANLVFNSKLNLTNTDVIIIEDIIDTGLSLTLLIDEIQRTTPASLKTSSSASSFKTVKTSSPVIIPTNLLFLSTTPAETKL